MQNSLLTWALSALSILISISPVTCNPLVSTPNCVETRTPSLPLPVTVLHTFEFPSWCENLAIRSNSQILVTRLDTPELLQVDPTSTVDPVTVFAWNASEYMGALGISETSSDIFYVVLSAFVDDSFVKTSGVNSIFEVDMNTFSISDDGEVISNATVTKLVDITDADFLNGMTTLNTENILVADVYNGWVYKVNTLLGNYTIAIDDPLMKFSAAGVNASTNLGVNGIKIKDDGFLYWTNTALGSLNRIEIDEEEGTPVQGSIGSVVVGNVPKADDFVFGSDGVAWVAQNQMDELSYVPVSAGASGDGDDDTAVVVAGSNISTTLAGVSAGHFGRGVNDTKRLYLTTSGALALAINGTVVVAGTVSYVDTEGF